MATKVDTYTKLIARFRLVTIKTDEQLEDALDVCRRLMEQDDLDPGAVEYLGVLAGLIEAYEDRRYRIADAPVGDVLRELMQANGLTQSDLSNRVGISQSTISAVLTGKRALTKGHVLKLAAFFNLDPSAFLPTGQPEAWSTGAVSGKSAGRRIAAKVALPSLRSGS
jgi:HTH-type transcriptional regulator / antitoxin HigA